LLIGLLGAFAGAVSALAVSRYVFDRPGWPVAALAAGLCGVVTTLYAVRARAQSDDR
jgi:hypothetical protein